MRWAFTLDWLLGLCCGTSDWPSGLDQFGEFLRRQGLSFERRGIVPSSGDKLWQYGTTKIGVRVIGEHGFVWSVRIADIAGWPQQWYAASELQELLTGKGKEFGEQDSLAAQMRFVEEHWPAIVDVFQSEKSTETHTRLKELAQERIERLLQRYK